MLTLLKYVVNSFLHLLKPEGVSWKRNGVIIPIVQNWNYYFVWNRQSFALLHSSLICRIIFYYKCCYIITLFILVQTFCIYKSTSKYLPSLFIYCESMSKNLTFVYIANRLFTILRMNFIASAHYTYHFFMSLRHLSFTKAPIKFYFYKCFFLI